MKKITRTIAALLTSVIVMTSCNTSNQQHPTAVANQTLDTYEAIEQEDFPQGYTLTLCTEAIDVLEPRGDNSFAIWNFDGDRYYLSLDYEGYKEIAKNVYSDTIIDVVVYQIQRVEE